MSEAVPARDSLPDLLKQTRETRGEEVFYRFANGLVIKTEVLDKADTRRVLPLGRPQGALMNHLLNFPGTARSKLVFEPFAGSGVLGFMALRVGASHVDFVDINPRALDFQRQNAALNRLPLSRFTSIHGDIASFIPPRRYELILANPPFVPTPRGLDGAITSNGGPEGNRFVEILLGRLEEFLEPSGRALIYVFQLVKDGQPLVVELASKTASHRFVEVTPSQARAIPFETYCSAYTRLFPKAGAEVGAWRTELVHRYGADLSLCHYVVDVGAPAEGRTGCEVRANFAQKFGEAFLVPSADLEELAFARVFENVVPAPGAA